MRSLDPRVWSIGVALAVSACGSPTPSLAPPKAATPAPAASAMPASTPAVLDPKGSIDAAKTAASAATAATNAREASAAQGQPQPGVIAATTAAAALTPSTPKYDAGGRRDPFESLESRLGSDRSSVTAATLTGVIQSGGTALALVETSAGIGYILKPGDTLADGRLLEVGVGTAVFSIAPKPGSTTNRVVLKLASD